jgi:hypothetical protein
MKHEMCTFMTECDIFQHNKVESVKNIGILQSLPLSPTIWMKISMDFIVVLPKCSNKSVIMAVVDRHSKYVHFCSLQHPPIHNIHSSSNFYG